MFQLLICILINREGDTGEEAIPVLHLANGEFMYSLLTQLNASDLL